MSPLEIQAHEFNRLRERLATEFGLDADEDATVDTADGETSLTDFLVRMVRSARERVAQAEVCSEQMKALGERKKRHLAAADRLRELVAETMLECGIKRLTPGDLTATASMTKPKPEVVDEDALAPIYTRTVRKPDMDAIKGYFAECQAESRAFDLPGVVISNGRPSLTVRI